jgi:hypothetical protein
MIPQAALDAWAHHVPWPDPLDLEQDLILSRLIVDIANHPLLGPALAFRGGTSIHKLHLPRPWRYSNDLDYVRTTTGPAKALMSAVREVLSSAGPYEADYESKADTIAMRFDTTPSAGPGRIRVWLGLTHLGADPDRVVAAFHHYLDQSGVRIVPTDVAATLDEKVVHQGFRTDLDTLVASRPDDYAIDTAAMLIRDVLLPRIV